MKSTEVAQGFLDLARDENMHLSNLPLQKLVFFAQGIHLAAHDTPITDEPARAWDFGPVFPDLYETLRKFGRGEVKGDLDPEHLALLDEDSKDTIQAVWEAYKNYPVWEMVELSHEKGTPWDTVWNGRKQRYKVIPNELIKQYYLRDVTTEPATQR